MPGPMPTGGMASGGMGPGMPGSYPGHTGYGGYGYGGYSGYGGYGGGMGGGMGGYPTNLDYTFVSMGAPRLEGDETWDDQQPCSFVPCGHIAGPSSRCLAAALPSERAPSRTSGSVGGPWGLVPPQPVIRSNLSEKICLPHTLDGSCPSSGAMTMPRPPQLRRIAFETSEPDDLPSRIMHPDTI